MQEYEFTFVIDAVDADLEQSLQDEFDAFVGGHGRTTLLTMSCDGIEPIETAHRAVAQLRATGVQIRRVYDDLVTRGQIAERADVTRQAVGLWVRQERQTGQPFPEPHVLSGGGLWRWGEVNDWLRETGLPHDDLCYLSATEVARVNVWLSSRTSTVGMFWGSGESAVLIAQTTATTRWQETRSEWLTAADSKRTDFALGA